MSEFLAPWLQLREPADLVARSESLAHRIARTIAETSADGVRVLDLATGTGSNVRYLAGCLPESQSWLLVDRDPKLLEQLPGCMSTWAGARQYEFETSGNRCRIRGPRLDCRTETRQLNLGHLDEPGIFAGRHLVTASALLDLVSEGWLRVLAARCRAVEAAALFALTYSGSSSCTPEEPEDDLVRGLLNRHQHRDTGLGGTATGPDATACAERCFAEAGYVVRRMPSHWVLGTNQRELQTQLVNGWGDAAIEIAPDQTTRIERWLARRRGHIDADRSHLRVGHEDLAAWLPSTTTGPA